MGDFNKREWMEENELKLGEWKQYRALPRSIYFDVRMKDGREIGPCWPLNAVEFVDIAEEKNGIKFADVLAIRPYLDADEVLDDEEGDDEDDEDRDIREYDRQRHRVDSVED